MAIKNPHDNLDIHSSAFAVNPYPVYNELRGECPVMHSEHYGGFGCYPAMKTCGKRQWTGKPIPQALCWARLELGNYRRSPVETSRGSAWSFQSACGDYMNRLLGKTAIITGAARGIGAACAEVFVREGARVAVLDLNLERGEALAQKIGTRFYRRDVTKAEEVDKVVEQVAADFGTVNVLVNNAGRITPKISL